MKRFLAAFALMAGLLPTVAAQDKKRVAILDFDYGTVRTASAAIFGTDRDIGKGIADILIEKMVSGGAYSVIERSALDKILAEQNFANSDRADASTAARIGRVLGVDAIIIGSITQFGQDDKSTNVGGGALGGLGGRFGVGGVGRREAKAVVTLSARMVNTETGEVLTVANGRGESKRSGTSLLGAGGSGSGVGLGGVDMGSQNFRQTLIGEAAHEACQAVGQQMQAKAASIPGRKIEIEGLVADVAGDVLILNVGTKTGVRTGLTLEINRKVREVRDPASGKVLRSIVDKVGQVVITEADDTSSVGKFSGAATPKVGDQVKAP
ncbi:MAG: curli production assembly protein CsgG [Acidimicrobiia bacterium]|nr:curli production assembly protein CsgG [Acidimicrobiia bacterium]